MVDKTVTELGANEDGDCVRACQMWLEEFILGDDRLVVDSFKTYLIISEYRNNVVRGGVAENLLNLLASTLFSRILQQHIELDANGFARLPEPFSLTHGKDRKFVAVAIQCDPYASILNATDTDWGKEDNLLREHGLTVRELCPEYIKAKSLDA